MDSPVISLIKDKEKLIELITAYRLKERGLYRYQKKLWSSNHEFVEIIKVSCRFNRNFSRLFAVLFMKYENIKFRDLIRPDFIILNKLIKSIPGIKYFGYAELENFILFDYIQRADFFKEVKSGFKHLDKKGETIEEIIGYYMGDLKYHNLFYLGEYNNKIYCCKRYLGYTKNSLFIYSMGHSV